MSATRLLPLLLALVVSLFLDARAQVGIGIGPGDTVSVATGQGFVLAIVTARQGHLFQVRIINGPEVTKQYPAEVRRHGKTTAYDRANGVYDLGDRVQALFEGRWIDTHVIAALGMEYQVELPGNRTGWAKPEQLRFLSAAPPKEEAAKAGVPPAPGLVSCAGKIEGRYASDGAFPVQLTFRSGKVTFSMMGDTQTGECWFGDGKLHLTMTGEAGTIEVDLNDDGSLQAPFGELKKKGK